MKLTGGDVYSVDYYMRRGEAGWQILDVIADGVSYVKTYRSDYAIEIEAEGLEALIGRLERTAREKEQRSGR